jgi:hypothetical protein
MEATYMSEDRERYDGELNDQIKQQYGDVLNTDQKTFIDSTEKHFLDIKAIFAAPRVEIEDVYIKQWNGWVHVKAMNGEERDVYENSLWQGKGKNREVNIKNARAKLVALTVVDDNGKRMFRDSDVHALGQLSAAALDTIYDVASRLAGISDDDLEELGKPSDGDPSGSNTSA